MTQLSYLTLKFHPTQRRRDDLLCKVSIITVFTRSNIIMICTLYSVPHFFMTDSDGTIFIPFAKGTDLFAGKLYYWTDKVVGLGFPFVALLTINTVIIHTLRKRSSLLLIRSNTQDEGQGLSSKGKSSEKQIIIMLLLVTFGFLILISPTYGMTFYTLFVYFSSSPKLYAGFILFMSIGQRTFYTNFGINFYLYVIYLIYLTAYFITSMERVHWCP